MEPITPPISPPPSFDSQLKNAGISLRNPRYPELLREPAGFARETDWRASLFSLAARFAVAAGVVALVALIFFLMVPASRQTDTASTSSEVTGSTKTDPPPSGQGDVASKPALDQFKALLATAPVSQPAPQEQSQPLLQGFIEWRQKDNPTQTTSPATIDSE